MLTRICILICAAVLTGSLVWMPLVDAETYYVSTIGSDTNPGTERQPFRTINRGTARLQPGDTLFVQSGTYAESLLNPLPSGLSASQPTTITGPAAPNRPILRPTGGNGSIIAFAHGVTRSYLRFNNLVLDGRAYTDNVLNNALASSSDGTVINGLTLENCEAIGKAGVGRSAAAITIGGQTVATIRNCSIHGWRSPTSKPGAHGFYWKGANGLIEGNDIYDNNGYGLQFHTTADTAHNNVFRNNYVHGHDVNRGLYMARGHGNLVYNNIIANNRQGIWFATGNRNNVFNNTIYNNGGNGIEITGGSGEIRNNIVYQNGTNILQYGGNVTRSHNLTTDPKFVNAAAIDFRLQSSSPAVDGGITLSWLQGDIVGTPRPYGGEYDIGAHEYMPNAPAWNPTAPWFPPPPITPPLPPPSKFRVVEK